MTAQVSSRSWFSLAISIIQSLHLAVLSSALRASLCLEAWLQMQLGTTFVADVFAIVHSHCSGISDRNSLQKVIKSYELWSIPLPWLFLHLLITCSRETTFDLILTRPIHSSFANYWTFTHLHCIICGFTHSTAA